MNITAVAMRSFLSITYKKPTEEKLMGNHYVGIMGFW